MFYERKMKLWDIRYTDAHGNKQLVRYCAISKTEALRLFKSEQQRGEVLECITEHRERKTKE